MSNNDKISLFWYSYYQGGGYNSRRLERIVPFIDHYVCNYYGFLRLHDSHESFEYSKKFKLSRIPLIASNFVYRLEVKFHIQSAWRRLIGMFFFQLIFSRKLSKDKSTIVYTTMIMSKALKKAKQSKKLIVEARNAHPLTTLNLIKSEQEKYGINKSSIYMNKRFIDDQIAALDLADKIIVLSKDSERTYLMNGYSKENLKYIPLNCKTEVYDFVSDDNRPLAFVSTASHSFVKGTHRLLDAWKDAKTSIPLLIVGDIQSDIHEYIDKYGPFPNVEFVGRKNIHEFYLKYNIVGIQLSLTEGAIQVTPEFLSHGFPVITSHAASSDLIVSFKNGIEVDVFNKIEIVDAIQWFSDAPHRFISLRNHCIDSVSNRSLDDFAREIAEYLIEEIE